jgi:hypothetical protein
MPPTSDIITLDQTSPAYGDAITFTVAAGDNPVVSLYCYQDGEDAQLDYANSGRVDETVYTLKSLAWPGGSAHCTAQVRRQRAHKIITTGELEFTVSA